MKFFVILLLLSFTESISQDNIKANQKPHEPMYKLLVKFPVNVSHKYIYTEESKITRIYSNNKTVDFNRELTYHFSLRAPSAKNKEGFQLIEVSVDSMVYKFTTKDTTYYFNDQSEVLRPPKVDDFQNKFVPLGLNFNMTISPYYEVAKIAGDMLLEKRNYVSDPKTGPSDKLVKATWVNGLDDYSLMNIFDIVKGFPPIQKVDIDSTWTKDILTEIEGSRIIDSVEFKLENFNIKFYTITGKTKGAKAIPSIVRLNGLSQLIDFTDAEGSTDYKIKLYPGGNIQEIEMLQNYNLTYRVLNDYIQQKVETKKYWKLDKMYNW